MVELSHCHFYGTNQTSSLSLEKHGIISSNPKLLLLRFHSLMESSLPDKDVEEIFQLIGPGGGNMGFEIRRTGGSSGMTNAQTDVEFLNGMHFIRSSLPRRLGGCKIMRFECHYSIAYRNQTPKMPHLPLQLSSTVPFDRGVRLACNPE